MALFWIVVVVATWIRSTVNLIAFGNRALFALSLILAHSCYIIFHPASVSITPVTCYHLPAYRFEVLVPTVDGYVFLDSCAPWRYDGIGRETPEHFSDCDS